MVQQHTCFWYYRCDIRCGRRHLRSRHDHYYLYRSVDLLHTHRCRYRESAAFSRANNRFGKCVPRHVQYIKLSAFGWHMVKHESRCCHCWLIVRQRLWRHTRAGDHYLFLYRCQRLFQYRQQHCFCKSRSGSNRRSVNYLCRHFIHLHGHTRWRHMVIKQSLNRHNRLNHRNRNRNWRWHHNPYLHIVVWLFLCKNNYPKPVSISDSWTINSMPWHHNNIN